MDKVVFFTGHISEKFGGFEEFLLCLGAEMEDNLLVIQNDYYAIPVHIRDRFDKEGVNLLRCTIHRNPMKAMADIYRILNEHEPSLLHVNFHPVSYITIVLAKLMRVRKICWTMHSMLSIRKYSKSWWYHKICTAFADKIICVSRSIEEELRSLDLGKDKRVILPLGVNLRRFDPVAVPEHEKMKLREELNISADDFVISVVAQIRPVKRLDVLIKALNILINQYGMSQIKCLVIGGTFSDNASMKLETEYQEMIERYGLGDQLTFLGIREDTHLIYSISDMSGLTSSSEGLGLSLVEAAAMGLPLFGSKTGGVPEVIHHDYNGFLFEVGDFSKLADGIRAVVLDEDLAGRFGDNSRKLAAEIYDIEANTKILKKLYTRI